MSRSLAGLAALRVDRTASVVAIRAACPRGALLPGRSASALTAVVPAQLLPCLSLGGGARSVGARVGTNALVHTATGLGMRSGWGGVSIRFVGSGRGSTGGGGDASKGPDGRLRGGGLENSSSPGNDPGQLTSWIRQCNDVGGLLELLDRHGPSFDYIHVGAAWGTLAKMPSGGGRSADGVVLQRLQVLTRATVQAMGSRQVSNILSAMAKLDASGRMDVENELVGVLLRRATGMVTDFKPQDIAHLSWALASMSVKPDAGLLEAMQGQATATAGDFKPQE
ncbi:hypothetical protein T484DRAFT_1803177, partial [Baffinella frigidus]